MVGFGQGVDAMVLEVQPGIESLSTSTLKLMRKGTTAFQNIRFFFLVPEDCCTEHQYPAFQNVS